MRGLSIRKLRKSDVSFVHQMVLGEGWNDRVEDIERVCSYEPNGCFIAEAYGTPAGHVFTVNYGKLGWIGLLIVKAEYRRRGVGRLLMEKAVDYLRGCKAETLRLEAVPEIADLYRRLGFVDEYDSLRFVGTSNATSLRENHSVRLIEHEQIRELARFDLRYFGADRKRVLSRLYQEYPQLCFASCSQSQVVGYVMCREAEAGYNLGPWVCDPDDSDAAAELLDRCLAERMPNDRVYVGVPSANATAVSILRSLGFQQYSKSIRMRLGPELENECAKGIFAIGGPMKG